MSSQSVTPRSVDYSRWYTDVIQKAELADYAPVRGCMIIRPYGYELWEGVRSGLDRRFKATGHQNAYFPLFIPMSFLQKEAEHVEGFAPELAVVTHGGGKELEEPLVVRPTSETVIGHAYANWIQSYRDLPVLINQWANVVRWELRTRLFLRTMEFLWQEGHTAHATYEEAHEETLRMLDVYADFAINDAAIPVIRGRKSDQERFAGAVYSYSIEAMMGDRRALQAGTSHNLGQNFAKAFDIKYLDRDNELKYCWTTSWGLSTRMVGAVVMAHGDDKGLRLPPVLAPYQVVAVPIYRDDAERSAVMPTVEKVVAELRDAGVRVHVDDRAELTPGFKFNDWEMRGVPLRAEIGPKDVEKGTVALVRRDIDDRKQAKLFAPQAGIAQTVPALLGEIQASLLGQATAFRDAHLRVVDTYDDFKAVIEAGDWALAYYDGSAAVEDQIKADTGGASSRCFPLDQEPGEGACIVTGKKVAERAWFARAY
ncbi:MAG: proline--tRNA ligase [Anaerolineae bacterium]|nr:proline--tRNA ligase [Anaerolineae bacterium]